MERARRQRLGAPRPHLALSGLCIFCAGLCASGAVPVARGAERPRTRVSILPLVWPRVFPYLSNKKKKKPFYIYFGCLNSLNPINSFFLFRELGWGLGARMKHTQACACVCFGCTARERSACQKSASEREGVGGGGRAQKGAVNFFFTSSSYAHTPRALH